MLSAMRDGRAGWNEIAAVYDRTRAFPGDGERAVPAEIARTLRALGAARILDLGCGTGRYALPLARSGLRVVGADRSAEMLEVLQRKRADERLAIVRCDAEALPFRRAFDAVLFAHFLHLVPSIETLAGQLGRVLLPGAHLVLVDTSTGRSPAELRVLALVMPELGVPFAPWPAGDDSRGRRLLRELMGHLGAQETSVGETLSFPATRSLREALADVRARTWWTCRVHPEDAVLRAADAAERRLLAEGADLDDRHDAPVEVRLVLGRLG
jgi:ubiquinone/menaquinone biosynthesis C-methylase UbiE